jgi:hypothetical protein
MGAPATADIDTSRVDLRAAAAIEAAEARAWADMYAAAPREFAEAAGVSTRTVAGALVMTWAATGRRYFSRTIGLGVVEPASPEALDDVLAGYAAAGIGMFLIPSQPHCQPSGFADWLRQRGLEPFDAQDRVVRGGEPLDASRAPAASGRELRVERVTPASADEWAAFLQRVYRLDTGAWLQALIDRPGWRQYLVREGREIVAARGMYLTPERVAWVGMDGPVPGLATQDFDPDVALWERIVSEGVAAGAGMFIADIEAPSPTLDSPAYRYFARLGFRRPYARTHWRLPASGRP